jgi:hypothetical protein
MSVVRFVCPDGVEIACDACLALKGCRMGERCATEPYLRACMDDREFRGVSPSMSGNGPRYIYLDAILDKAVDPQQQTWAMMGLYVHNKMSYKKYTQNVIAEEKIGDDEMRGIPDVLERDEDYAWCEECQRLEKV